MKEPTIYISRTFSDERGRITYNNDFTMDAIKRCFSIVPRNEYVKRSWHGHKIEQNWFQALKGSFLILIVAPDDWEHPSFDLQPKEYVITEKNKEVLHIPGGYVTQIKALQSDSELLVFSDFTLEQSLKDDYRFDADLWFYESFM